ncbi:MAG TPA: nickel-binding protein [Coleofasciculaceae cyanobacterium]|jgi:hypothetical protein
MPLIIVETTAEQPLTGELLNDAYQRALPCFAARNATWRYSLLSVDGHRMICTFEAPDAESLRESYRRAESLSRQVWVGELPHRSIWAVGLVRGEAQPQRSLAVRYVMEGTYPPLSETDWNEISRKFLDYCAECDIEWLQSYLSSDRTKVIYELKAPDITPIQEAQHKLEISFDRVWSAQVLSP